MKIYKLKKRIIRKNIFKNLLPLVFIYASLGLSAQDQKTLFQQWGEGDQMLSYGIKYEGGIQKIEGVANGQDLKLLNMDDPYAWGVKLIGDANYNTYEFHADNNAHPVVLYVTKPRDKGLKYYMQDEETILRYRLCIVGDYMYFLNGWKSKDNYQISSIYKKGKHLAGFKLVKEVFKANKTVGGINHREVLQAYLDKEMAIQKQKTPSWNKANQKYFDLIAAEKKQYWKGEKEARAKLNRKLAEIDARKKPNGGSSSSSKSSGGKTVRVKISNKTSKNYRVYWKENGNWKSSGYSSNFTGSISVPAGAALYYSSNGSAKKPFMTAPKSGTASYKF